MGRWRMRRQKWRLGNCCQRSRRKTRRIPGRSVSTRRKCQLYLKTKPNCAKRSTEKSLSWVDIMGRNHWCLRQQQFPWKAETEVNVVGCWVKSSKRLGVDYTRRCDCPVGCVEELSGVNRGQTAWAEQWASVQDEEKMEKKDGEHSF